MSCQRHSGADTGRPAAPRRCGVTEMNTIAETAALDVRNVSHAYGTTKALQDVSLTVPQSRFTALLGPNGAGKTTLFSLITRLYDTRVGSIDVLGHRVARE